MTPEQRERRNKAHKRRRYLHSIGMPPTVPAAPAVTHARMLHQECGMSMKAIAVRSGLSRASVARIITGRRSNGAPMVKLYRSTVDKMVAVRPTAPPSTYKGASWRPVLGSRRRVQALIAVGFSAPVLAELLAVRSPSNLWRIALDESGQELVNASRAHQIKVLYDKLECADPADHGGSRYGISRSLTVAREREFAPPHCWDSDTIDDPAAIPEWTGLCGTWQGYNLHRKQHIPYCAPCRKAMNAHITKGKTRDP